MAEVNRLQERHQARQDKMAKIRAATAVAKVRVVPTQDKYRKVLKHPATNVGFRAEGSVEWPLDQFTKRRIHDGSVTIEEREKVQATPQKKEKEKVVK